MLRDVRVFSYRCCSRTAWTSRCVQTPCSPPHSCVSTVLWLVNWCGPLCILLLISIIDLWGFVISTLYFLAGLGQQTLGEEYCDIVQTTASKLKPSVFHAAMQVVVQAMGPSALNRLSNLIRHEPDWPEANSHREHGIGHGVVSEPGTPTQSDLTNCSHNGTSTCPEPTSCGPTLYGHCSALSTAVTLDTLTSSEVSSPLVPVRENEDGSSPTSLNNSAHSREVTVVMFLQPSSMLVYGQQVRQRARRWLRANMANIEMCLPLIPRLHLALFYLHGRYFQLSKRLAGISYVYSGSSFQPRPYYGVMGILLLVQMGVEIFQIWR